MGEVHWSSPMEYYKIKDLGGKYEFSKSHFWYSEGCMFSHGAAGLCYDSRPYGANFSSIFYKAWQTSGRAVAQHCWNVHAHRQVIRHKLRHISSLPPTPSRKGGRVNERIDLVWFLAVWVIFFKQIFFLKIHVCSLWTLFSIHFSVWLWTLHECLPWGWEAGWTGTANLRSSTVFCGSGRPAPAGCLVAGLWLAGGRLITLTRLWWEKCSSTELYTRSTPSSPSA